MRRSGSFWLVMTLAAGSAYGQELLWSRQFGTPAQDSAAAAAPDGAGGVFIAGSTRGDLARPNLGDDDVWIARFDRDGHQLWVRQFGTIGPDSVQALTPDGAGGVYAAGQTMGSLAGPNAGGYDRWVARFDADGHQLWVIQQGTALDDYAWSLAADGAGGVFAGGTSATSNSGLEPWFVRVDASGTIVWTCELPAYSVMAVRSLASDGAGGVFMGAMLYPVAWAGRLDGFGRPYWLAQYPGGFFIRPYYSTGVAPDRSGGTYAVGLYDVHATGFGGSWAGHYSSVGEQISFDWFSGHSMFACIPDGRGGVIIGGDGLMRLIPRWEATPPGTVYGLAAAPGASFFAVGTTPDGDIFLQRYGPCYANCDESTTPPTLNVNDFACFLNRFAAGDAYANCDGSTEPPILNVNDYLCFLSEYAAGCP